jgi:hypothetical protein
MTAQEVIAAIRAEIERRMKGRHEERFCDEMNFGGEGVGFLAFLDTLKDDVMPIPDGLDEAAIDAAQLDMQDRQIMEDSNEHRMLYSRIFRRGFKAGAEWMAGQFEKNRLAACDEQTKEEYEKETELVDKIVTEEHRMPTFSDAIIYGINWQKQQMEKEAVEGYIEGNWREQEDAPYELYAISDELDSTKYKIGDKVKLIILKDDGV